jgi:hypothetical protein
MCVTDGAFVDMSPSNVHVYVMSDGQWPLQFAVIVVELSYGSTMPS